MGKADWSAEMLSLLVVVMLGSSFSEGCILDKCELRSRLAIAKLESELIAKLVCTVEYTSLFNTSHVRMVKNLNPEFFNSPRPFFGYKTPSERGDYFPNWPPAERWVTNSPPDGVTEEDYIVITPVQNPWSPVEGSGDQAEGGQEEPSLDGSGKNLDDKPKRQPKRQAEEKLDEQSEELSGDGPGQGFSEESSGFIELGEPEYFDASGEGLEDHTEPPTPPPQPTSTVIYDDFEEIFSGHHENEQDSSSIHNPLEGPEPPSHPQHFDETLDHGSGEGSGVQFDKTPEPATPQPPTDMEIHGDSYDDLHPFNGDYGFGEGSGDQFDTIPETTTPPPEIHVDSYDDLYPGGRPGHEGKGPGNPFENPEPSIFYDNFDDLYPGGRPEYEGEGPGNPFENPEPSIFPPLIDEPFDHGPGEETPEPTNPQSPTEMEIPYDSYDDLYPGRRPGHEGEGPGNPFENPEPSIYYDNFDDLYPGGASGILYGIFQLNDMACRSESSDHPNFCQLNCEDLLDDDIADDIECLKTLYPQRMVFVEECHTVVPSEYFAECD